MATTTPAAAASADHPMSLPARFIGVLTSPRATFQNVAAHPRWFGMLAVTLVLVAIFSAAPLTTESGRQAAIDQQISAIKSFGVTVTPDVQDRIERGAGRLPYTTAAGVLIAGPIMALIVSAILFAVFNAGLGGEASFKQVFAVQTHAGVVSCISAVFSGVINYFRGATGSVTNVAALLPMIDEQSFIGHLLGTIDVFLVWWVLAMAIGLGVLYRRRTRPIAITLFGLYAVIALVIAVFKSRAGGA
jgi:hypothetical protein